VISIAGWLSVGLNWSLFRIPRVTDNFWRLFTRRQARLRVDNRYASTDLFGRFGEGGLRILAKSIKD
jgi:hypothetical protein